MTVYLDILFIINAIFDGEILAILLKLYGRKIPILRLLLSACIGGLSGIFVFIPYFKTLLCPPAEFFLSLVPVMCMFLPCKLREFITAWGMFLGISFVLAGGSLFFGAGIWGALFLPLPIYIFLCIARKKSHKKYIETELCYKDRTITVSGFFDSGNMLAFCGKPVIIANASVFSKLFGAGFSVKMPYEWIEKEDVRAVPYSTVGKSGVMFGVRIDSARVSGRVYEDIILGYMEEELAEELILSGVMA